LGIALGEIGCDLTDEAEGTVSGYQPLDMGVIGKVQGAGDALGGKRRVFEQ